MPAGDGTGPMGMGPMTGRGTGFCAGYNMPGYMNPIAGRGFGMGFGRGYGRGAINRFYPTGVPWGQGTVPVWRGNAWNMIPPAAFPSKEAEIKALKEQTGYLEESLKNLNRQIKELEEEKDS